MGTPAPTIAEAVFARFVSRGEGRTRGRLRRCSKGPKPKFDGNRKKFVKAIHDALYCSKICSYAQGFQLMRDAQEEYDWELNFGQIALIWRGGCIIRAGFLQKITEAYKREARSWPTSCSTPISTKPSRSAQKNWRKVVATAAENGIPVPDLQLGPRLLRQLPDRTPAAEPAPGPARLLRRPHLRAHRQAPRRVLPHRLAGQGSSRAEDVRDWSHPRSKVRRFR